MPDLFSCTRCENRFNLEDVKEGKYFVTTSTCLDCYKQMAKSRVWCFGKKKLYNSNGIVCQECPDEKICRSYINYKGEFKGE